MKMLRIFSLSLSLIMLLSAFASCGHNGKENDTKDETTGAHEETEDMPEIEKKNYNEEFYLSILPDSNPEEYFWIEESDGSALSEAIYTRQERVKDYLGVSIKGKKQALTQII